MSDYGVTPTGYRVKPYSQRLAEIEALLRTEFGPDVVQSAESPLGQLNALFANLATIADETNHAVYQSYDPDQAEGVRLDALGKMRLIARGGDESDQDYRQAITNAGRARNDIQDLARAIVGIPGVTFVRVYINETTVRDASGIPPGGVAVAVLGGDDSAIAAAMRQFVVPGITTIGNVYATTIVDGFCRTFQILRPILIPVAIQVTVRVRRDALGCPAPSVVAIRDALAAELTAGPRQLLNGDDVDAYRIRSTIEGLFPNVEVVLATAQRDEDLDTFSSSVVDPNFAAIAFIEMATISADDIVVTVAP